MIRLRIVVVSAAILALMVAFAPGQAWAPVPPKNCGMLKAQGKRLNIKADQLRCRTARTYARRYLARHRLRGYSCRDYGRGTKIEFRCSRGRKVVFAIRR
jgi:hypothetical protein